MNGSLSRAARMLLGTAALMSAAVPAFAAGNTINLGSYNTWTVYAFGNAAAVADAFRALTNFSASPMFQSLVSMIAVLGVLGVGAAGGFNPGMARRLIGYFVSVFLVCYFLFGVTNGGPLVVNIEVVDTVDNTWKAPVTVPAVVGIPAAIVSTAGFKLTKAIEASFALPDSLKMSNGAPFNLATSMIADASQARITDPNLAASLAYYVQDCFTLGVARGVLRADTLIQSTNFLQDIKFDNKAVMVSTMLQDPVGSSGIVSCSDAWGLINSAINAQGATAAEFLKDASAWTKTPAMSVVNAAADSTAQWASNSGVTDGAALVKQSAVLAAFRGAYTQAANQTGNSEFLTGMAMTQATEAQRTSWIVGAEVFNKTMGYVFAIIQVFVYAITPLVLCAALVPNLGLALLKNFSQILLWLAIWQPMLSIVNFIIVSMQQAELGGVLSNGSNYGFTLSNVGIVSEKTANLRAAASFVGTMVPALAWAMVKGSVDFSRVIGSAVGENFAQGAANTMTTGNFSLNQGSMDSFTANKNSIAATGAQGNGFSTNGATGSRTNDLGGSDLMAAGGSRASITPSSNQGVTDGGSTGDGATGGITGSKLENASNGTSTGRSGSGTDSASGTDSSGLQSSQAWATTVNGRASLIKQGNGGGNPAGTVGSQNGAPGNGGANGNGQPPGNSAANTDPKKNVVGLVGDAVKAAADRIGVDVNGSVTGSNTGTKGHQDQAGKGHQVSQTGGTSASGATSLSGGENGAITHQAGTQHGFQKGDSEVIQGIPSSFVKAQMMAAYMRPNNGAAHGKFALAQPRESAAGDAITRLHQPNAVGDQVAAREQVVEKKQHTLEHEAEQLRENAAAQKRKNDATALGVLHKEEGAVVAGAAAAKVDATTRALDGLADKSTKAATGIELFKKGAEAVGLREPEPNAETPKTDAPKSNASGTPSTLPATAAAAVAAAKAAVTGHFGKDDHGNKPQDAQHAKQPDAHGSKPQDAQHAKPQDGQGNKPQDTQHAKQPDAHGNKPQAAQQAKPQDGQGNKPQDTQHAKQPDAQGNKPQDAQHAKPQDGQGNKPQDTQQAKQPDAHGNKPQDAQHAKPQDGQGNKPQDTQQTKQQAGQGNKPQDANKPGVAGKPAEGQAVAANQAQPQSNPAQQQADANGKNGANDKSQHLASQAGKEHERDLNKPDQKQDERALAQSEQQRQQQQQQQQQRELQERQLASAVAVGQLLQTAQAAPQPQQQPGAVPGQDLGAPQAANQQQQLAMNGASAAPNPFSGEKAATSEGQLQGQVQMAEQRAERMNNQLRGVEEALASTDGRKPGELPELISQARDMMRNA